MRSIRFINFIRFLTLSLSLVGFGCHFAQCALFSVYQSRTQIRGWLTAGHWQYILWYISFGFSILCALAVCTHATCCKRAHILKGDKCLGIVNTVIFLAVVLAVTFMAGQEPWTNGIVEFKEPAKGFITYCSLLDENHDATYPLLFQRCLLINSTYVASLAICLSWSVLTLCACFIKPRKKSSSARLPNEKNNWNHHPYTSKLSSSYDTSRSRVQQYTQSVPLHIEKTRLPGMCDYPQNQFYPQFPIPGGWKESQAPNVHY